MAQWIVVNRVLCFCVPGSGTLCASWQCLEAPHGPPPSLAVQFVGSGTSLSGMDVELVGTRYRMSLVKKRFATGDSEILHLLVQIWECLISAQVVIQFWWNLKINGPLRTFYAVLSFPPMFNGNTFNLLTHQDFETEKNTQTCRLHHILDFILVFLFC